MKQLKPRDKVTQHMTRDGLTLDNQTTGESINISSREAEQDYSAAEPGGTTEKVLERAGDIRERSKAKRAAKDGANTAAQATGPASRLQFTAEERADPALSKYIHKAEKRADKLDTAKEALPKKRVVTKETVYDEAKGKAKTKLHFDKVEKPAPKLKPNPASRPMEEAGLYLHGKIHEVEHENVGVEGGHKGEELAERQAGKAIRSGIRRHKLKPYRAAAKAEKKAIAANAEYIYQKSLRDNPEMAQAVKNPVARFWQKQKIKRDYAKAARAAGQTAQGAASATKTTAAAAKKAAEKSKQAASFVARHWKGVLLIGGVGLMLMLIMGGLQSCTAMFGSAGTGVAATSYLSEDSDMLGAEAAYADMEADLQYELDNYESLHPGYDEYRFDLDEIGHDPYVLTSILSALHDGVYTLGDVQGDLAMLFEKQYTLTQTIETETRYRTETRTDSEGNTYTVQVPYTYYICNVKLENFDMSHLPVYIMGEEQMSLYAVYMHTLGNRPDLFPNGTYPNASTVKEPTYYEIPPEALEDATFAAMMAEAEKYVGYPYVWGGSSPSTSFDCSGFVSWVINHSGWDVGRLGAQGLCNICTPVSPEQAKPGDLVFFVGTYDTPGVSHVGIYVGNSVMLHCGDPISYTNLNSSYWQQHIPDSFAFDVISGEDTAAVAEVTVSDEDGDGIFTGIGTVEDLPYGEYTITEQPEEVADYHCETAITPETITIDEETPDIAVAVTNNYNKEQVTITVHYYIEGTTTQLREDTVLVVDKNSNYDVSNYPASIGDYDYESTTGDDLTGLADEDKTIIIYYERDSGSGGGGHHNPSKDDDDDDEPADEPEEDIPEEEVPLAETPWLNTVDHYAYIVGYPEDYVTGQPTEDESRWPIKPQANITRAEVATIFFRLLTDEARDQFWMTTNDFPDVAADAWYNNAISTMVNAGIIQGYEDGTFRPNDNITRAEFAAIASRFMSSGYDVEEDLFTDISGHWARENINDAAMTKWINGYPDGTFLPDNDITRAEAVTLVNNVLRRAPDADHMLDSMIKWPDNMDTSAWYYEAMQEATNSHDYDMFEGAEYETWTALEENRDWAALEQDWMNAHRGGGEVM